MPQRKVKRHRNASTEDNPSNHRFSATSASVATSARPAPIKEMLPTLVPCDACALICAAPTYAPGWLPATAGGYIVVGCLIACVIATVPDTAAPTICAKLPICDAGVAGETLENGLVRVKLPTCPVAIFPPKSSVP